jgi:hypothetical protein
MTSSVQNNYTANNAALNHNKAKAEGSRTTKWGPRNTSLVKENQKAEQSFRVDSAKAQAFSLSNDEKSTQNFQKSKFSTAKPNPKNIALNKKICQTHSHVDVRGQA